MSRIMFHTYITHGQAKSYLGELIESGLIQTDVYDRKKYFTTVKGIAYLSALDSMTDMLGIVTRKVKLLA